jgi:AraC-like DNA-binding protein
MFLTMSALQSLPQLRLKNWKNLDAQLIWIYEGKPEIAHGSSSNNYYTAWYLKAGHLRLDANAHPQNISQGKWVILPPMPVWREFSPRARILSIHFEAKWVTGQRLFDFSQPQVFSPRQTKGWLAPTIPMLKQVKQYCPGALSHLGESMGGYALYAHLQGYFLRWLSLLWAGMAQMPDIHLYVPPFADGRAQEMKYWLERWPLNEPFRQDVLARAFHLSLTHCNRLFSVAFETTPKRYINQRRLAFVQSALRSSSQSIKEIAHAAAFRHPSEFSSWFKQNTGKSPKAFRSER